MDPSYLSVLEHVFRLLSTEVAISNASQVADYDIQEEAKRGDHEGEKCQN